jgi:hypothetical protein
VASLSLGGLVHTCCISLDELPLVLLGSFEDALRGSPSCAEGGHERAVMAAQDHYVWVRLVYVVAEFGEEPFFFTHDPAGTV